MKFAPIPAGTFMMGSSEAESKASLGMAISPESCKKSGQDTA
jgi:hypothetical protein